MIWFAIAFTVALVADLVTKRLTYGEFRTLWDGVIDIHFARNFGAAFNILEDARIFLLVISIVLILALSAYYIGHQYLVRARNEKRPPKIFHLGFGFFLGGAVGNLVDRIWFGYVRDWIRLTFVPNFPIFNLADIFINIGLVLIVIYLIFYVNGRPFRRPTSDDNQQAPGSGGSPGRGKFDRDPGGIVTDQTS